MPLRSAPPAPIALFALICAVQTTCGADQEGPGTLTEDSSAAAAADTESLDRSSAADSGFEPTAEPGSDTKPPSVAESDGTVDSATASVPEDDGFCRRATACGGASTCNLSSGLCEARSAVKGLHAGITGVYPLHAAPGDVIVMDGRGFYVGLIPDLSAKIKVGSVPANWMNVSIDENRVVFNLPPGASGEVTFKGLSGSAAYDEPVAADMAAADVVECQEDDPMARGVAGSEAADSGPYAAGFATSAAVDKQMRIYYPAICGGPRRPAADGPFPFVLIMHGDGCVHIDYEYLARHLATWGFVSAMPFEGDPEPMARLVTTALAEPEKLYPPLAGKTAGEKIAVVGHSKGTNHTGFMLQAGESRIAGLVFLGPVVGTDGLSYSLYDFPGMTIGGTEDTQSFKDVEGLYSAFAAPRYTVMLEGANHDYFTDHKVWEPPPSMGHNRQLELTQSFVLSFLQKVFGEEVLFPMWLDDPVPGGDIASFEKSE